MGKYNAKMAEVPLWFCVTDSFSQTLQLAGCTNDIMTSDHSPVFASFEVGVASQFVSKQGMSTTSRLTAHYFVQNQSLMMYVFIFQIQTVHLRVVYRYRTVWPPWWQNQRPSSSSNTIPAAWKVRFVCIDWLHHIRFCFKMSWGDQIFH